MVPPCSDRISRVPPYSRTLAFFTRTGLSPALARLSRRFRFEDEGHWPGPRSLATTSGVSVDVLSSGYLDVSVRRVRLPRLWIQRGITQRVGFPHSEIHGSKPARGSPWLIATCYVLHRLSVPRHPPNALLALDPSYAGANPAHAGTSSRHTRPATVSPALWMRTADLFQIRKNRFTMTKSSRPNSGRRRAARRRRRRILRLPERPRIPAPIHTTAASGDGGGERDRTDDLLLAKQALSQLSYAPGNRTRRDTEKPGIPVFGRPPLSGGPGRT